MTKSVGPGAYSPERADSITRTKVTNINMGTSDLGTRLEQKTDSVNLGPGHYESDLKFAKDTKTFTIGEKREFKVTESVGPGQYEIERAEVLTKSKAPKITMGSS